MIAAEEEELRGDRPDRDQDIKPFAHHSRVRQLKRAHQAIIKLNFPNAQLMGGGAEEGDDGDDDGNDDDDEVNAWNLRKSSASSLDTLSNLFPEELQAALLPIVTVRCQPLCALPRAASLTPPCFSQVRLAQPDWRQRESAILALGAVAEGCRAGLKLMAPQIVQFMLPLLADPRPLVRSIACWTLGRYCKWLFPSDGQPPSVPLQALQAELLDGLLKRVADRSKPVQAAACCALAVMEEEAGDALVPKLQPILQHLTAALGSVRASAARRQSFHGADCAARSTTAKT